MPTQSDIYSFTTSYAPVVESMSPSDGSQESGSEVTLSATVSDPDGGMLQVGFFDASNDTQIGDPQTISSGGTASVTWSNLEDPEYSWYVMAADQQMTMTQSSTISFDLGISLEAYRVKSRYYKHLIWALSTIKRKTPTIKNLKDGLGIAMGLPFSYEAGTVDSIESRVITIGDYSYDIPADFTISVSEGESVDQFQLLCSDIDYEENMDSVVQFKKKSTVKFYVSHDGNYDQDFVDSYFESIVPKSLHYTIEDISQVT